MRDGKGKETCIPPAARCSGEAQKVPWDRRLGEILFDRTRLPRDLKMPAPPVHIPTVGFTFRPFFPIHHGLESPAHMLTFSRNQMSCL